MHLDDAYANAPYIPHAETYIPKWKSAAAAFRADRGARMQEGIAYGDSPRQILDLFWPERPPEGLCVFVHGGFWMKFDRSMWSHLAAGPLARGWAVAMPSYDLCPEVRISDITGQVAKAIARAGQETSGPIALAGHSAGGHLVARMAVPGVLEDRVAKRISHVMALSPLSDLRPLLQTTLNDTFKLDEVSAKAESPVMMRPMDVPVTVWVGAKERPAFIDQARWLAEAWAARHVEAQDRHHFDVIEPLTDAKSQMVQLLLGTGQNTA